jgi:membrane peptidoglycan carboxypeptidase
VVKKTTKKALNVYANLTARRAGKKDADSRVRAEYLATLPKHPVKRLLYRMHPKRFWAYWWSKKGAFMALKVVGVSLAVVVLFTGALFAYYRKDLNTIQPSELANRVQTTVNKYYDRNGVLLWEDAGGRNYKLVVNSNEINDNMKKASVAIEDKNYYSEGGVSVSGIGRAIINNFTGGSTQGGSTLTQQLVKQVFFTDQASERGIAGIPRKIKEAILSVEVERMYSKDQLLTLYLNESPYGGLRNGVESAAETYFGKSAKDLDLAQCALLASIPQSPTYYNPYNTAGNADLTKRQHVVLDDMVNQKMITQAQADAAKAEPVLDQLKPEADQYSDIKAPHFVQYVKQELDAKLGTATVGKGGLTIKTTLDYGIQQIIENNITKLFQSSLPSRNNFDNAAVTIEDNKTGQVLGMLGSRDYSYPGYGQTNEAVGFIQPGSSIKPLVYAELFSQKPAGQANYGAGSILPDNPLPQSIYKTGDGQSVQDFDNRFQGNIPIAEALDRSRNIPAIEAMYISGQTPTINLIHATGDTSYCTDGVDQTVGLASAIGGCGSKQIEHVNAYTTLANNGVYSPHAEVLSVTNASGDTLLQWKDQSKQVVDPQVTYVLADIMSTDRYRQPTFAAGAAGFNVPGVKTATKTGTSNLGQADKDLWMMGYSTAITEGMWVGNHDTRAMNDTLSSIIGPTFGAIMEQAHKQVLAPEGKWKPGDWFTQPAGVQIINGFSYPSWYSSKTSNSSSEQVTFDTVSKKKATSCTPDSTKTTLTVFITTDPITKRQILSAPDGYDVTSSDDVHTCNASDQPQVSVTAPPSAKTGANVDFTVSITPGSSGINSPTATVNGNNVQLNGSGNSYTGSFTAVNGANTVSVTVTDQNGYSTTNTATTNGTGGGQGNGH